jgi:hypothetical protein
MVAETTVSRIFKRFSLQFGSSIWMVCVSIDSYMYLGFNPLTGIYDKYSMSIIIIVDVLQVQLNATGCNTDALT